MKYSVFYSWQSQLPDATNRDFIRQALKTAVGRVRQDPSIRLEADIDEDARDVPGSPSIPDVILEKIDAADLILCDVSIVQGRDGDGTRVRPTPNANVLYECGYARKRHASQERCSGSA